MTTSKTKIITLLLVLSTQVNAESGSCKNALNACIDLTKEQDVSIQLLKAEVKALDDRIASDESAPTIPWWAYGALGVLAGVGISRAVR